MVNVTGLWRDKNNNCLINVLGIADNDMYADDLRDGVYSAYYFYAKIRVMRGRLHLGDYGVFESVMPKRPWGIEIINRIDVKRGGWAVSDDKMDEIVVEVKVKGPGSGRESVITALESAGIIIRSIEDVTPLPHDGCRPPKPRRV